MHYELTKTTTPTSRILWYTVFINKLLTFELLLQEFLDKGGTVNRFYLRANKRNSRSVVHLNGWHSGKNVREAMEKALAFVPVSVAIDDEPSI